MPKDLIIILVIVAVCVLVGIVIAIFYAFNKANKYPDNSTPINDVKKKVEIVDPYPYEVRYTIHDIARHMKFIKNELSAFEEFSAKFNTPKILYAQYVSHQERGLHTIRPEDENAPNQDPVDIAGNKLEGVLEKADGIDITLILYDEPGLKATTWDLTLDGNESYHTYLLRFPYLVYKIKYILNLRPNRTNPHFIYGADMYLYYSMEKPSLTSKNSLFSASLYHVHTDGHVCLGQLKSDELLKVPFIFNSLNLIENFWTRSFRPDHHVEIFANKYQHWYPEYFETLENWQKESQDENMWKKVMAMSNEYERQRESDKAIPVLGTLASKLSNILVI